MLLNELLSLQERVKTKMELNGEVPLSATTTLQQVSNLLRQTLFGKKKKEKKTTRVLNATQGYVSNVHRSVLIRGS